MKTALLALVAAAAGPAAQAQPSPLPRLPAAGPALAAFVPPRYGVLPQSQATGDLNRDGRPDLAVVLRPRAETAAPGPDADLPPRLLLVLFGTPTGYALAAQSARAILCQSCGGAFGDPFQGLAIAKGVLSVMHYGGSNWRWSSVAKFRYQQGDFYAIGETKTYGFNAEDCPGLGGPMGLDYRDTNFVTGDYEVKKISDECKLLVHKRGKNPPAPLRKLADYSAE